MKLDKRDILIAISAVIVLLGCFGAFIGVCLLSLPLVIPSLIAVVSGVVTIEFTEALGGKG